MPLIPTQFPQALKVFADVVLLEPKVVGRVATVAVGAASVLTLPAKVVNLVIDAALLAIAGVARLLNGSSDLNLQRYWRWKRTDVLDDVRVLFDGVNFPFICLAGAFDDPSLPIRVWAEEIRRESIVEGNRKFRAGYI